MAFPGFKVQNLICYESVPLGPWFWHMARDAFSSNSIVPLNQNTGKYIEGWQGTLEFNFKYRFMTEYHISIYMIYHMQEGYCHCGQEDGCDVVKFSRLVTVKKNDEQALKQGLAKFGPASISINVGRKSLKFYSSGVYDDTECSKYM